MNIWGKVFVGLILATSLPFFYLAARTLKTHQYWKEEARSYVQPLEDTLAENELLMDGDPAAAGAGGAGQGRLGIRQLTVAMHDVLVDRGRAWKGCIPSEIVGQTGAATVQVESPDPHQIQSNVVLYVFEERPILEGGGYLGEYKVAGVNGKEVSLVPTMTLSQRELDRIKNTQGTWAFYERMPADRYTMFSGLDRGQLDALMPGVPAEVREEYLKHGQPAAPDDPPDRVADGKYQRQLRDYALLFHDLHRQAWARRDEIAAATTDKEFADRARDDTQRQVQLRQAEIDDVLKPELKESLAERDTIQAHHLALDAELAAVQAEVAKALAANQKLAEEWTALQLEAAQRINALSAAQGGSGKDNSYLEDAN